jgi:topoisomerase IV subunit B
MSGELIESYSEESIKTLEPKEHIRLRPGMYIGKLGDGSAHDDGIYVLLKEVIDNSIDEFMMGNGKSLEISIDDRMVRIRDHGRGIPLGKLVDAVAKMNTGAKYDSKVFKKSVGLNGVGLKAVNALSSEFLIRSYRDSQFKEALFQKGTLIEEKDLQPSTEDSGVEVIFRPDREIFGHYRYLNDYVSTMLKNYAFLNAGLVVHFNGEKYVSKNGLLDLLQSKMTEEGLYPIIHLKDEDIEVAITHGDQYGEEYYSFVNGQHTIQGGTHLVAFREALVKTVRDYYKKEFDPSDIRRSVIAAVSIKVEEPIFESQTKTRLGSKDVGPNGPSIRNFIHDFLGKYLDNFLHKHPETADILLRRILDSEKERKAISGIQKLARDRAKKSSLHNKKLRDCRVHYNSQNDQRLETSIFITEGDSASGSITKSRNVNTQAVFSLKGKPKNTYGETKKLVYENEEFNLLQAALNIEDGIDDLRYNNVIIATDADVDGMHIRLLLITFFLEFFPDLIKQGHLYILQTPLFRCRNTKQTFYCYSEDEKLRAIKKLTGKPEITRFKGLGEISPDEFRHFIGPEMRLEPVLLRKEDNVEGMLEFYMGKNTPERQDFIIGNLRIEEDAVFE